METQATTGPVALAITVQHALPLTDGHNHPTLTPLKCQGHPKSKSYLHNSVAFFLAIIFLLSWYKYMEVSVLNYCTCNTWTGLYISSFSFVPKLSICLYLIPQGHDIWGAGAVSDRPGTQSSGPTVPGTTSGLWHVSEDDWWRLHKG